MKRMKLIIQIPCYNEAETLEVALNSLPRQIDGIDTIEYLVIDDGSEDHTAEVARNWGVHHIVHFKRNQGLARGFMAGINACLELGADLIVNTDADNQYCGEDIRLLVQPILDGRADMVIGERPISEIRHFSPLKKRLQRLGSWVVRKASATKVPDAPSGFRAFSREAALHMNVINEYTYTLETIIQAGHNRMTVLSVPVRTNPELRKSRLFKSMYSYVKKSMVTIVRTFAMYRPLAFFTAVGSIPFLAGFILGVRFLYYFFHGSASGHVQSLILASTLLMMGFMTYVIGIQADIIAANRKIMEEIRYYVKKQSMDDTAKIVQEKKNQDQA